MKTLAEKVTAVGIVPVVVINDVSKAEGLAKALVAGGIPVAEVTFRTEHAAEAIKVMAEKVPEILVGAGTVHTPEQAKRAVDAGAKFIVTPGWSKATVEWCLEKKIPIFPGVTSPSNIEEAMTYGFKTLKFFPAEAFGGMKTLKAFKGPYGGIKFMPTGGINTTNIADYLASDNIAACGGSWMVPKNLVEEGKFDEITKICRDAIKAAYGFRILHIGINSENKDEALKTAKIFSMMFGLPIDEKPGAYFAGEMFEVCKTMSRGKNGHIAIETTCIDRAVRYFENLGVEFDESTKTYDENGKLILVYFKDEVAGFAIHLRAKA